MSQAVNLLKQLGSGVRPTDVAPSASAAAKSADEAFSDLLAKARSGELSSHKLVKVDEDAKVSLSDEQLAQITLAADQAEAQGVRKALVMFDDKQVILDVASRTVMSGADIAPGKRGSPGVGLVTDVDGVINLSSKFETGPTEQVLGTPPAAALNPSITRLLEKLEGRAPAA